MGIMFVFGIICGVEIGLSIGLDLLSENDKCKVLELDQDSFSMDNL
jgi:hypothetical protein